MIISTTKCKMSDLDKAILIADELLARDFVEDVIEDKEHTFDFTNQSNATIVDWVERAFAAVKPKVYLWTPRMRRFSKAYASTTTGDLGTIKLNRYKLNRSIASLVGSILHEYFHIVEYYAKTQDKSVYFNHGDNKSAGKGNSVQYWLGTAAKLHVEENLDELLSDLRLK